MDEPGHVYHLFVCRSPERDRIVAALREAEIGCATYYLPPLHLQPALRFLGYEPGSLPETEKARARELLACRSGPASPRDAQERVVEVVRAAVGAASRDRRSTGIGSGSSPPTPALVAARLVPRVPAPLRHRASPSTTRRCFAADVRRRRRDQARGLRPVRLLQPLVALRLDARHVGRRARRRRRLAARRPHALLRLAGAHRRACRAGSRSSTCLLARVRRRLAPARAHAHRAAAAAASSRAARRCSSSAPATRAS